MKHTSAAVGKIYLKHGAFMRSVVKDAGVPEKDADDVVHDAIASIQEGGVGYAPAHGALESWLYVVARNHAYKYFRQVRVLEHRQHDAASLLDGVDVGVSPGPDPEEEILCREGRRILDGVLARMPRVRREVFVDRHIRELPWAEIVERREISESTAMRYYEEALREVKAAYTRWAAGKAYALPFPLFLALSFGEQWVPAGARFEAANDADERDASRLVEAPSRSHEPSLATSGANTPMRGARRTGQPSEAAGAGALLQRIWRSRLTHQLLGAVAGAAAMFLFRPFTNSGAPPPGPPPPSGEERPQPSSSKPMGASTLPPAPPAGASPLAPGASSATLTPSSQPFARVPRLDSDADDRDLLDAAFDMAAKGRREEARRLLDRHARKYPDSKRSAQRAMLIAQLSN